MKGNYQSMQELIAEIERIERAKEDFLVPHRVLKMEEDGETFNIQNTGSYRLTPLAHTQVAEKLGIPKRYYDQMNALPGLRAYNVNAWLQHSATEQKLVRVLDGQNRAFLSDRFVPFDNFVVMEALLPTLRNIPTLKIASLALTETRMYVQLIFPTIEAEVRVGDVVQAGITLSNSEVGYGAVDVSTLIWRLRCTNGLIGESLLNRHHVGRRIDVDNELNIYKRDTLVADINAFKLRLRDVIEYSLQKEVFERSVRRLQVIANDVIPNPVQAVQNVTKRFGFSDKEGEGIITNLITEGDATRWGLVNSITALAKSIDNCDRQFQMEQVAYEIVELPSSEWKQLIEQKVA